MNIIRRVVNIVRQIIKNTQNRLISMKIKNQRDKLKKHRHDDQGLYCINIDENILIYLCWKSFIFSFFCHILRILRWYEYRSDNIISREAISNNYKNRHRCRNCIECRLCLNVRIFAIKTNKNCHRQNNHINENKNWNHRSCLITTSIYTGQFILWKHIWNYHV